MHLIHNIITFIPNISHNFGLLCRVESDNISDLSNNLQNHILPNEDSLNPIFSLFFYSSISTLATIIVVGTILLAYKSLDKKYRILDRIHLKFWFITTWILGVLVYDVGMCTGSVASLIGNAPMAVVHAFGMFVLSSDVSEIHSSCYNNWLFMAFFSLAHTSAAAVSTLFVIKHFGFNIKSRFKVWRATMERNPKEETYVFWGVNPQSIRLAQSIHSHYKALGNKNYRIIVVKTNYDADDTPEGITGFNRIFGFLSLKNAELNQLDNLHCLIVNTYVNLNVVEIDHLTKSPDILGGILKLKNLKKLLSPQHTSGRIHFLFLSDNEHQNIHDVAILHHDTTLNPTPGNQEQDHMHPIESQISTVVGINPRPSLEMDVARMSYAKAEEIKLDKSRFLSDVSRITLYCHARRDSIHRVMEYRDTSNSCRIKLVDSSLNSVALLSSCPQLMPVNFVTVEKDASVSSQFNALVVGFSEVGLECVKFLYEFGAFVKSGSDEENPLRSDFRIDVVDKEMASKAGDFLDSSPSIPISLPFIEGMDKDNALINLHNTDCNSVEFTILLNRICARLNYVVLATDNDELNMQTAIKILEKIIRTRGNASDLCILVRIHNDDDGHFSSIATYYNNLWKAQTATNDLESCLNQSFPRSKGESFPIHIFGEEKDSYTFDLIINDSIKQTARLYKEIYAMSADKNYRAAAPGDSKYYEWDKDEKNWLQLTPELKKFHPTYCGVQKVRRTQQQDLANTYHRFTKQILADKALKACGISDTDWKSMHRVLEKTDYTDACGKPIKADIQKILDVLAQTEHLRWNASHQLLGFVKGDIKSETRRIHPSLTDWKYLVEYTRSFDYNVVDISLGILSHGKNIERPATSLDHNS
ncbi:MAG: hypothetical protein NC328_04165 [Muribaculum sp.]|nr:hypothetical protein [Muribaculum sp.]